MKPGTVPPSSQVVFFSAHAWEQFVEAACRSRVLPDGSKYAGVKRLGGSGDGGRDVEAKLDLILQPERWDLFQCKHYKDPLSRANAFQELAKMFRNLAAGTYPRPGGYFFCATKGTSVDLHNWISRPATDKKTEFLNAWKSGKTGFKHYVPLLTAEVLDAIENFNFSTILECEVKELLSWHALDVKAHYLLFGIEDERGDDPSMPASPHLAEQVYVSELIRVYSEAASVDMTLSDVEIHYGAHFHSQRQTFYCAEGLKRFSRDQGNEVEFENLLAAVSHGLNPIVLDPLLTTGLQRVSKANQLVSTLAVQGCKLHPRLRPGDLPGTCHHLVNNGKLKWI